MINTNTQSSSIGETFFKYRDYTPIPLILIVLFVAKPSVFTATLGTIVLTFGELFRIYSVAFIGSISRTRKESLGNQLITSGPFKWVRNPLYLGNFFIVFGLAIYSGILWFCVLTAALFYLQYHYIVQYEEGLLEKKFGNEYGAYKASVPAWFPKSLPKLNEIEWPDSFTKSLKSEKRTLSAIAGMLILLILFS